MKVLFIAMDGHGHLNALLGVAKYFHQAGHSICFAIQPSWECLVKAFGYQIEIYDLNYEGSKDDHLKKWSSTIADFCPLIQKENSEKENFFKACFQKFFDYSIMTHKQNVSIIEKVKPDLIIYDSFLPLPSVINSKIKYINVDSVNPMFISQEKMFEKMEYYKEVKEILTNWLNENGINPTVEALKSKSPFLNIYIYPEDLDYGNKNNLIWNYFRLDNAVREDCESELNLDLSFVKPDEKLIYFSLGSLGSGDLELMKKMVKIFSKSKHKFVISKGAFHEQLELGPNMIGQMYINQIKLLPKVDLVITHGGNNTTIETLYFGKPLIVLPLFADQHLNGERIEEKGLGKNFNPYTVTEEEMLNAIDSILQNQEMNEKVQKIGENIRKSKSGANLVTFVENALEKEIKDKQTKSDLDKIN